jgi:hypothetical protein
MSVDAVLRQAYFSACRSSIPLDLARQRLGFVYVISGAAPCQASGQGLSLNHRTVCSATLHNELGLHLRQRSTIFRFMATGTKKTSRARSSANTERAFVYRGIKIAPISGKRSQTAEALRDALRTKSEQSRDESTRA